MENLKKTTRKKWMRPHSVCVPLYFLTILTIFLTGILGCVILASGNFNSNLKLSNDVQTAKLSLNACTQVETNIQSHENSNLIQIDRQLFDYFTDNLRDTPYPGVVNYTLYTTTRLGLKPLSGIRPLRADFGPVLNDVTLFRYQIQVPLCKRIEIKEKPTMLVTIVSAPDYFHKRESIRQTWLQHLQNQTIYGSPTTLVGVAFVVGLPKNKKIQTRIEEESRKHGDILQIDMVDDYFNLTLKSADDDTYVNVRNLAVVMKSLNPFEKVVYGGLAINIVNRGGKYVINYGQWPWYDYPSYLFGNFALIAGRSIRSLLAAAQTTPYIPFEDAYLYGLCAEKAKIGLRYSDRIVVIGVPEVTSSCFVYTSVVWITSSVDHFIKYHLAIEDLYNNKTQCFIADSDGSKNLIDPMNSFSFSFQTNSYGTGNTV